MLAASGFDGQIASGLARFCKDYGRPSGKLFMLGEAFRAPDLIRGGEPVLVSEDTATRTSKPWETGLRRALSGRVRR